MTAIGWVAGIPIPRERLDTRVRELRAGRLAGRLPAVGSKEDRQFLRWTAQVLLTEELCRIELARLTAGRLEAESAVVPHRNSADFVTGLDSSADERVTSPSRSLTRAESLHLGSINAAAWSTGHAMSELFELVTTASARNEPSVHHRTWYRVVHAVGATPLAAAETVPQALGWTTLDDLPAALGIALRAASIGSRIGPIRSGIGWHFATVTATERRADPNPGLPDLDPPRLGAFNRWLDQRRRALVTHAPGFEHPGDPSQPDNTHRH